MKQGEWEKEKLEEFDYQLKQLARLAKELMQRLDRMKEGKINSIGKMTDENESEYDVWMEEMRDLMLLFNTAKFSITTTIDILRLGQTKISGEASMRNRMRYILIRDFADRLLDLDR